MSIARVIASHDDSVDLQEVSTFERAGVNLPESAFTETFPVNTE
ncbi:MAG: hypothetical protein ABJC09_08320 [Terriglobia bacterium]